MCVCLPSHLCAVTKVTRIKCRHNRSLFFSTSDLSPSTNKSCQNNKKCKTAELFMKSHMKVIRGNKSLRIASKRRMCIPISESQGGGTVLLIWSADEEREELVCRNRVSFLSARARRGLKSWCLGILLCSAIYPAIPDFSSFHVHQTRHKSY